MSASEPRPSESKLSFRVRYVECDPMGVMHHSWYLPLFEMGRVELLRQAGWRYRDLEAQGVLFAVTKVTINYKRAAKYDDEIELVTRKVRQTHVRIDHAYEMFNVATRELLCTGETTIACIGRDGRVQAIPEFLGGKIDRMPT